MRMLLPMLDKASEYLSLILQNDQLVELLRKEYPEEFNRINWCQEIILELFYTIKDMDKNLLKRNIDIAMEKQNLEINHR